MGQAILDMTSSATFAIAIFGVVFCFIQTKYSRVSKSFAAFLAAVAANNFSDAFSGLVDAMPRGLAQSLDFILWQPSSLLMAPLFWIYVVILTSASQRAPDRLYRHFVLPALCCLLGLFIAITSPDIATAIYANDPLPESMFSLIVILCVLVLQIAIFPQLAYYLVLIVRRLMRHRLRLRDVYASTEEHELRWIYLIGLFGAVFWIALALIVVWAQGDIASNTVTIASIAGFCLFATTTLWGLRQRPPLVPDMDDASMLLADNIIQETTEKSSEKYEKSALSAEAAKRITGKLRAAMEKDHLHRDPNLSLWMLARHIGASPNYISQTLNEDIGESFFDFVNGYRIAEAKILLATTKDTVLTITYDVGFNARSSFYNAFKRVTGETPTQYRKTMSLPNGMDDGQV